MQATRIGATMFVTVDDSVKSEKITGYKLLDDTVDEWLNSGVDTIVFVDENRGRYASDLGDWLDQGIHQEDVTHLRQSIMSRV